MQKTAFRERLFLAVSLIVNSLDIILRMSVKHVKAGSNTMVSHSALV